MKLDKVKQSDCKVKKLQIKTKIKENKEHAYSMTPSLKTSRELASPVEVAPTNADESVNGVITTLSGTPVNASLPLILRVPSLRTGFVLRNMECLHV